MGNKTLLLASNGGGIWQSSELIGIPLERINLAYVTTASKGASDISYLKKHKAEMIKRGIKFEEVDVEGKNEDELRKALRDKNVIHVEGGNTFYLLKAIRESGFDKIVKELIEQGVVYIGSSAGSYIMCPTIEMATWKSKLKNRFGVTDLSALNIVPFLMVAHYVPEKHDEILKDKIANCKYEVKLLTDGRAIFVKGDDYKIVGKKEF